MISFQSFVPLVVTKFVERVTKALDLVLSGVVVNGKVSDGMADNDAKGVQEVKRERNKIRGLLMTQISLLIHVPAE